ncbi:MAG: ATP-binding protein [Deltaproteobacteria bacterium]|jgi:DNA polymerase III delta prime subunit|nr:ATP-binding protein [Deltaproteobacteria bacterium]
MTLKRFARPFTKFEPIYSSKLGLSDDNLWLKYYVCHFLYKALGQNRVLGALFLAALRFGLGDEPFLVTIIRRSDIEWPNDPILSKNYSQTLDTIFNEPDRLKYLKFSDLIDSELEVLNTFLEERKSLIQEEPIERKFQDLKETLCLSSLELSLLKLLFVMEAVAPLDDYLVLGIKLFTKDNWPSLAGLLEASQEALREALRGRTIDYGLILKEYGHLGFYGHLGLGDGFFQYFDSPDSAKKLSFLTKALGPELTAKDFNFDPNTWELLKKLLKGKGPSSTHILFYGPKNVGKTQMARLLAALLPGSAFEIQRPALVADYRNRIILARRALEKSEGSWLIIDEADKILQDPPFGWLSESQAAKLFPAQSFWAEFLRKNGPPCLWIVNNIKGLSASTKDLFAFSQKFEPLGTKARLEIWRRAQKKAKVDLWPDSSSRLLAKDYPISPAAINHFFHLTQEILTKSPEPDPGLAELWTRKQARANLELNNQRFKSQKMAPSYRATVLSLNPSVADLLASLLAWRDRSLILPHEERKGQKLLFSGGPGTGKTELANYLAYELDLELTQVRFSDLISPYVGQSEANIAQLFKKYQNALGIILVDEVESFLFNRARAQEPWELSRVNEFLAGLDRFTGLFIGTSNRPANLDPAARRRLGREIKFGPLADLGKLELFNAVLKPLTGQELTYGEIELLSRLTQLVPADFAVVAESSALFGSVAENGLDNQTLLRSLAQVASERLRPLAS